MPRVARVGDPCGGAILNSRGIRSTLNGSPIAVVGDQVAYHGMGAHSAAIIFSGGTGTTINGIHPCRTGDYATCGHTVAASPTTDDSSESFAPPPGAAGTVVVTEMFQSLDTTWGPPPLFIPGHQGYILQWKTVSEAYGPPNELEFSFNASATTYLIPSLVPLVEYSVRVITTRRFAMNGPPTVEVFGTPLSVMPPPPPPP